MPLCEASSHCIYHRQSASLPVSLLGNADEHNPSLSEDELKDAAEGIGE